MSERCNIPLFPLHTVLFPGGYLPLKIFEPRYLGMVSDCMKSGQGFGVCLIRDGAEVGSAADIHLIGTLARIQDWDRNEAGLLTLTAEGLQRFHVERSAVQSDQLMRADVMLLENEPRTELPDVFAPLAEALESLLLRLGRPFSDIPLHLSDAGWVSARLIELLPLPLLEKQTLLEGSKPLARLEYLAERIDIGPLS